MYVLCLQSMAQVSILLHLHFLEVTETFLNKPAIFGNTVPFPSPSGSCPHACIFQMQLFYSVLYCEHFLHCYTF